MQSIQTLFSRLNMILEENILGGNQCIHMCICHTMLTNVIIRMFTLLISSNNLIFFLYSLRRKDFKIEEWEILTNAMNQNVLF